MSSASPFEPPGLLLTAAELTGEKIPTPTEANKSLDGLATPAARERARIEGPIETRRHNFAVACSLVGGPAEMARLLHDMRGKASAVTYEARIHKIFRKERNVSEPFALLVECVMGWDYYAMTTIWIERRKTLTQAQPRHVLERRCFRL